ncbi:hypothetical protein A6770_26045 [Nostoc minutum NIES-26]|uniref:Uncharacterized protein n=1 Tax=Nostoc minutum NIES-26 TaxID=1844469 RepID=A0A367QRF3_9NOSO|nr:hypothetical protein A6770_26045 [Nostoc minutum NIES-26]
MVYTFYVFTYLYTVLFFRLVLLTASSVATSTPDNFNIFYFIVNIFYGIFSVLFNLIKLIIFGSANLFSFVFQKLGWLVGFSLSGLGWVIGIVFGVGIIALIVFIIYIFLTTEVKENK